MMIWDPIPAAVVTVEPVYIDLFYSFPPIPRNRINCDYFYSYPDLTHITSTIPTGQSTDSTQVALAFPSENAVVQMPHSTGQNYVTPILLRRSGRLAGRGRRPSNERHRSLLVLHNGDHHAEYDRTDDLCTDDACCVPSSCGRALIDVE